MKTIVRYNPSITSLNLGDSIILDSIEYEMKDVFKDNFIVDVSSHLPVSFIFTRLLENADYKFVCGSNLLSGRIENVLARQWAISLFDAKKLGPAILVGAGWQKYNDNPNFYTKKVYQKILSNEYIHSVRDEYTEQCLRSCGINNVISTACPSMWRFTPEFCKAIPQKKANSVVTTITDYSVDIEKDRQMLETLFSLYENVYVWLQGYKDEAYLKELTSDERLKRIAPNLKAFDDVLDMEDVEFVGTRLHAGMRALQHQKRSVILSIDNRAKELNKNYNINIIERKDVGSLKDYLISDIKTDIKIPMEQITLWKNQFEELKK